MSFKKLTLISAALLFTSIQVNAHNVWVEQVEGSEYIVRYGHNPTEKYPENKLKPIQIVSQDGKTDTIDRTFKDGEAYFKMPENASIVLLGYDNGIWSKLANGRTVEKNKEQAPDAEFRMNPIKFGKDIIQWDDNATKTYNIEYEMVPQTKPIPGQEFDILVLNEGKPLPGVKVSIDESDPGKLSDENGIVKFTPVKGANKAYAEYKKDIAGNPDYDFQKVEFILSFDAE